MFHQDTEAKREWLAIQANRLKVGLNQFRGKPRQRPPELGTASEQIGLDDLCAEFAPTTLN